MNARSTRLTLVATLALSACASNSEAPPARERTDRPSYATEFTDVEDVAPLQRGFLDGYGALVRRVVLADPDAPAWMVSRPSFTQEYGIALSAPDSEDESALWTLTVVTANVYGAGKFRLGDAQAEAALGPGDFQTRSRSMPVDAASAREIASTFQAVVRRARNPMPVYLFDEGTRYEQERIGVDGTTYEFCGGAFYGRSWSPDAGPAADLVELGDQLVAAVDADDGVREERLRSCVASARALRLRVEAMPW